MEKKGRLLVFLLLFVSISVFPQGYNCSWVAPLPQGNTLNSAYFFNVTTGFVVGDHGIILKTTNAGKTWTVIQSLSTDNFKKIVFASEKNGFIIGQNGAFYMTFNGGANWVNKPLNTTSKLIDLHFINSQIGFVLTERSVLFRTSDGGKNWLKIQLPSKNQLKAMDFNGTRQGVIAATRYEILRSTDSGITWRLIDLRNSAYQDIKRANFSDVQLYDNAIVLSSKKNLFFSTDNGSQWITKVANSRSGYIDNMTFVNNRMAFLADAYGNILKSYNGVKEYQFKLKDAQKTKIKDIFMVNSMTGFAVGIAGRVFGTNDGGENWKLLTTGNKDNYVDIHYISPTIGNILTDNGKLIKAMDDGKVLVPINEKIYSGYTNAFKDLHFVDKNRGFAVTSLGNLYTTNNGGQSWSSMKVNEGRLGKMEFIDKNTGYVGSKKGVIYKTTNGGTTWNPIQTGINYSIHDISFVNQNVGFAACDKGVALKTMDGGRTWSQIQTVLRKDLLVVHAVSPSIVMFATSGDFSKMSGAQVIRSVDGGAFWKTSAWKPYSVNKFDFYNQLVGAALGTDGFLAITTNGGATWNSNKSITNQSLKGIYWKNENEMIVVGTSGTILKYTKGNIVADKKDDIKKDEKKDVVVKVNTLKRTLNGIPVEFSSIKKEKSTKTGVLKKEVNLKVGSNIIPVAAGTTVNYDSAKAIITRAQVKMDTKADVKGGAILLKGGTYVDLAEDHITSAVIKEDVVLTNEAGAIPVKAKPTANKPNIVFTSSGDLSYAYLSKDFSAQLDEVNINFPEGSRLDFSTGRISSANLTQNQKITLSGKEYELEGNSGASIKSFGCLASTGVFTSIRVTNGHTIFVNDMDMPIKGSSYVVFTKKSGKYEIRKFDIGKAMTVDLHKKRKIKQKSVKFGKTLVVEDGKIIRTAL